MLLEVKAGGMLLTNHQSDADWSEIMDYHRIPKMSQDVEIVPLVFYLYIIWWLRPRLGT